MRAVIIAGGNVGEYICDYVAADDFVICADSGFDMAIKYGITPNAVIGDMDSVKGEYPKDSMVYPSRKDFTDSELALHYALKTDCSEILMFGMIGTRIDHTLAAISLLKQAKNAVIIDLNNEIHYAEGEFTLCGKKGDTISVIPIFGDVSGVTTKGLDYPLKNGIISCGTSRGVSNVMTEDVCKITIEKGSALVIRSKD